MGNYIIIPGCCDLNRGDQALGWETKRTAEEAGFHGRYSILAERGEPIEQSVQEGYRILVPVLEHPSRKFKKKENIVYRKKTQILWGWIAFKDFVFSFRLLRSNRFRERVLQKAKDSKLRDTLEAFMNADGIFMKGGGLIQSHGGLIATYATYYRIYHILLAHALHKPVYIMPNSFGPFEGPGVVKMVTRALEKCVFVSARERKSQDVVAKELGLQIPCYTDLAFFLLNGKANRKALCERLKIDNHSKIVAITMRPYRFPNSDNPEQAYLRFKSEMRGFIRELYASGFIPLIIEHTFAITSHENDGDCIKDVLEGIENKEYRLLSDRSMNCRDLKSVYGCCDYIVGTRFHSLIFSLSNRVPGIAISYDGYKSIGIMKDMGLDKYVIDIDQVSQVTLMDMFYRMIDEEEAIKRRIDRYIDVAYEFRKKLIEEIHI